MSDARSYLDAHQGGQVEHGKNVLIPFRTFIKPYFAEFIGTFFFLSVIGWVIVNEKISGGVDLAGFAIGMALMVGVYMAGAHSGGHLNPAVSWAIFLSSNTFHKQREVAFGPFELFGYWLAQLLGCFLAGGCCYWVFGHGLDGSYGGYPSRAMDNQGDEYIHSWGTAMAVEICGTFTLALVVLNVATTRSPIRGSEGEVGGGSSNAGNHTFGLAIGSVVAVWAMAAGDISGGAYNPAVGTLPFIWGSVADVGLYWCGDMIGGTLAFLMFYCQNPLEFRGSDTPIANFFMIIKDEVTEFIGTALFCMVISFKIGASRSCVTDPVTQVVSCTSDSSTNGLCIGLMLMCMVYMGGHVSGGHFNPGVTLAVGLRGKCAWIKVFTYILSQMAGAFFGGGIAYGICQSAGFENRQYGFPAFGQSVQYNWVEKNDYTFAQCMLAEVIGCMMLQMSVLHSATCDFKNANNSFYGLTIGFSVLVSAYAFGPVSGGAFNPAVGLLPVFATHAQDQPGINTDNKDQWIGCYWTASFCASALSALAFFIMNPKEEIDLSYTRVFRPAQTGAVALGHMQGTQEADPLIPGGGTGNADLAAAENSTQRV